MLRSHHLGELNEELVGKTVTLCGWVERLREVGGVNFLVLRDRYAKLQLNLESKLLIDLKLGREDCIKVSGCLGLRPDKDRKKEVNGAFELTVTEINVLNKSLTPPFVVDDKEDVNEDLRLRYRYLDLRRDYMKRNMEFRHKVVEQIRSTMSGFDFLEVETPQLMKSTPEGARDFLVPSRIFPGEFYALPQSPQIYKQILQVSGLDRYYQFARCFRDEDARNERQLVHTQMDMEMSFVEEEDVWQVIEAIFSDLFEKLLGVELDTPFLRLDYAECVSRFGLDKPDLRFGMELKDIHSALEGSAYDWFREVMQTGGRIAAFTVPGGAQFSRKQIDKFSDFVKAYRARGIFYVKVTEEGLQGGAAKHIPSQNHQQFLDITGAQAGDLVIFLADNTKVVNDSLGYLRNHVAKQMDSIRKPEEGPFIPEGVYRFLWVTRFPLFEYNPDEERWDAMHHMFTMPYEEDMKYFETGELEKINGRLYDLVLNGVELGSGSIRIHKAEIQQKVFDAIGFSKEDSEERFGFFLESLKYGAPPHGGIALGLARLVMTLLQLDNMRDVIAFPNASSNRYLLDNSPSSVPSEQWQELGLRPWEK